MDSHKGIRAFGKLYGFLPEFATVDEDCAFADEDCIIAEEDCATFTMAESPTSTVDELLTAAELLAIDELLTAGVICCTLDDEGITHIETSEELDSGIYRSI